MFPRTRNRKTTIFNGKMVVFLTLYWFLQAHRLCFIEQELTPVFVAPGDPIQYPAQVFALKTDVSQQIYATAQGALYIVAQLSVFKLRYTGEVELEFAIQMPKVLMPVWTRGHTQAMTRETITE